VKFLKSNRRIRRQISLIALILLASLIAISWRHFMFSEPANLTMPKQLEISQTDEPIKPIPNAIAIDNNKVALGEKLFQDVRLSRNDRVSCLSCHSFNAGGADRRSHSIGINGTKSEVNTPTVFNVRFNFRFNWDGEFENLFAHLDALLTNPRTMDIQWQKTIQSLQKVPEYVRSFNQIYPDGLTQTNIKDAIVAYELSLYTPNARFDRFLGGDKQALTAAEKEGYQLFKAYGCISCHQGINVGGNMFQPFGVIRNYIAERRKITKADLGRYNLTKNEADRYTFRVPSLRNVALTPPYFHDGSAKTLEQAIAIMTESQLGRPLSKEQINLIVQFLRTLTGEYQGKPL
jgi:cytochrome c peroxidase